MVDKGTIRIVVVFIGLITMVLLGGALALIAHGDTVPDPVWALGGAGFGAFTTLLASLRSAPEPVAPEVPVLPDNPGGGLHADG